MDADGVARLEAQRKALSEDFRSQMGTFAHPEVEFNSKFDTRRIFEHFPQLRLKSGYALRLLTSKWVRYAGPYMFAVPQELWNAPLSRVTEGFRDVPGALPDFMLAIEGDDSDWSYLVASFLSRDADELGAYATGDRFCNQKLVTSCPWVGGNEPFHGSVEDLWKDAPGCSGWWLRRRATKIHFQAEDSWKWNEPQPKDWFPKVELNTETASVSFYTYKLYYGEAITRYIDTYQRGRYQSQSREEVVARGPNCIVT